MTLVIDDAHVIHQADPALLDTLQDLAKTSADRGDLRVVFVTSNGSVLQHMKSRCAWSSCSTFEVGDADISEEEAIKHLMAKRGWPDSDLAATEAASESRPACECATRTHPTAVDCVASPAPPLLPHCRVHR